MLSTCPSCLTQILHEDNAAQLMCECGEKFSPFLLPMSEIENGASSHIMAMSQKQPLAPFNSDLADLNEDQLGSENPGSDKAPLEQNVDYSESELAFAELRSYGEHLGGGMNLGEGSPSSIVSIPNAPPPNPNHLEHGSSKAAPKHFENQVSQRSETTQCMISAGDSLSGYQIESFMAPISVWSPTTLEAEDPLAQAHSKIGIKASQMGANGVVSIRWSFTPDGTRILLTGTPVKCRKLD